MKSDRSRLHLALSVAMLFTVLLAFGRTFFLRPFFGQPERWQLDVMPSLYVVHGVILTAWFVLLIVQAALIHTGRPRLHRRLGYAMAGLAMLVLVSGVLVIRDATPRTVGMGLIDPQNLDVLREQTLFIYHDLLSLVIFAIAVTVALVFRANRHLHRTMIMVGSLGIMGAAVGRLAVLLPGVSLAVQILVTILLLAGGPVALVVYEWRRQRRAPLAALSGLGAIILLIPMAVVLSGSEAAFQFYLRYLSGL